jgi:hypothetical protein
MIGGKIPVWSLWSGEKSHSGDRTMAVQAVAVLSYPGSPHLLRRAWDAKYLDRDSNAVCLEYSPEMLLLEEIGWSVRLLVSHWRRFCRSA